MVKLKRIFKKNTYEEIGGSSTSSTSLALPNSVRLNLTIILFLYTIVVLVVLCALTASSFFPQINNVYQFVGSWLHYAGEDWDTYCSIWGCRAERVSHSIFYDVGQVLTASIDGDASNYYQLLYPDLGVLLCDNCVTPYQVVKGLYITRVLLFALAISYIAACVVVFILLMWTLLPLIPGEHRKYWKGTLLLKQSVLLSCNAAVTVVSVSVVVFFVIFRPFALWDGDLDPRYAFGITFWVMVTNALVSVVFLLIIPACTFFVDNADAIVLIARLKE